MPNVVTKQYLAESANSRPLRHAARELRLPETYAASYGNLQLDRPLFVPEAEITAFAADLAAVFDILVSLPGRLFDGDLRRYCAALGMDDRLAALMCRGATGAPPLYARADAYHDGTSFKLLELNVGSELGGLDTAQLNRAFLARPEFADFAQRHELGHVDTIPRVAAALRQAALVDEPVVALIESTDGLAAHEHVFLALREALRDQGIDLLLGEIHELDEQNGKITLRGTPLDVVLRYFVAGELVDDPTAQQKLDLLIEAPETVLFTPLEGGVYASKGSLAMLHDPAVRATFSAEEHAVVDRVVPWTRLLGAEDGQDALFRHCRDERRNLVLKPGVGYGGVGTVVGHAVTDEEWERALAERRTGDHVVQRRVRPRTEPVLNAETNAIEEWVANWGIFVDSAGYAGGFVRALKPADGSVVSYSNSGTRGTCVFTTS
ncbi:hypothetical protein ACFFS4_25065 [Kutzneria kofuensis]|uniref:Circularly permuted ATP-grasp superfamily protein n=1 Tax=Kutzneria kofuensis TaxID=103725 RepID=A0A7W9KNW8_9PSEU|nr:hypothetical protein [Kutzneria kofuensis]MBB5896024.1 hypothetical protein [Kutzneria kofuensis]